MPLVRREWAMVVQDPVGRLLDEVDFLLGQAALDLAQRVDQLLVVHLGGRFRFLGLR